MNLAQKEGGYQTIITIWKYSIIVKKLLGGGVERPTWLHLGHIVRSDENDMFDWLLTAFNLKVLRKGRYEKNRGKLLAQHFQYFHREGVYQHWPLQFTIYEGRGNSAKFIIFSAFFWQASLRNRGKCILNWKNYYMFVFGIS